MVRQDEKQRVPNHVQIETINGYCTSRCIMCGINEWTRKPNIMKDEEFIILLNRLLPYKNKLKYLTLHGMGEPLLDKNIAQRVKSAKDMGFNGVGLASNCTNLDEKISIDLINARLDTIICGIDSLQKEVHEKIRKGTNFDIIVRNVKRFITLRNKMNSKTKIMVRFIRQKENHSEWDEYRKYWRKYLNPDIGDQILKFDIHNWAGKAGDANDNIEHKGIYCEYLENNMYIFSTGEVALCCADENGFFKLGNALTDDPIEIFNNEIFTKIRKNMYSGKLFDTGPCKNCSIPILRLKKGD